MVFSLNVLPEGGGHEAVTAILITHIGYKSFIMFMYCLIWLGMTDRGLLGFLLSYAEAALYILVAFSWLLLR